MEDIREELVMKKYELLIFDLDDTIIDNLENVKYAFMKMSEYLGEKYTEEEFEKWYEFDKKYWTDFYSGKIDIPYEKNDSRYIPYVQSLRYKEFYKDEFDIDKALHINEIYLKSLKEVVFPIKGIKETLGYLSEKYTLIIATNGPRQAVESKLTKIKCLDYIKETFSADMTKNKVGKPNVIYFEELLKHINYYNKEQILLIGDSLRDDIKGGMNAGIDTCWFNRKKEELSDEYKPTMIIKDIRELMDKL